MAALDMMKWSAVSAWCMATSNCDASCADEIDLRASNTMSLGVAWLKRQMFPHQKSTIESDEK